MPLTKRVIDLCKLTYDQISARVRLLFIKPHASYVRNFTLKEFFSISIYGDESEAKQPQKIDKCALNS